MTLVCTAQEASLLSRRVGYPLKKPSRFFIVLMFRFIPVTGASTDSGILYMHLGHAMGTGGFSPVFSKLRSESSFSSW